MQPSSFRHEEGQLSGGFRCSQASGAVGFFLIIADAVAAYLMHAHHITDNKTIMGLLFVKALASIMVTGCSNTVWRKESNAGAQFSIFPTVFTSFRIPFSSVHLTRVEQSPVQELLRVWRSCTKLCIFYCGFVVVL